MTVIKYYPTVSQLFLDKAQTGWLGPADLYQISKCIFTLAWPVQAGPVTIHWMLQARLETPGVRKSTEEVRSTLQFDCVGGEYK